MTRDERAGGREARARCIVPRDERAEQAESRAPSRALWPLSATIDLDELNWCLLVVKQADVPMMIIDHQTTMPMMTR